MDIMYNKKNIIVSIRIEVDKSLIYKTVLLMNPRTIIVIITFIIILIKD